MLKFMGSRGGKRPPYAPPFLKAGSLVIAQTGLILHYLGPRLKLVPKREVDRLWALQLQMTITDLVKEVHDTHHPLSSALYYEEQKAAAKRYTKEFWRHRVPKMLGYFETVLAKGRGPYVYNDISRLANRCVHGFYRVGYGVYVVNRFLFGAGAMLQGGNFVVTREALAQIGGYNDAFEFYGEPGLVRLDPSWRQAGTAPLTTITEMAASASFE